MNTRALTIGAIAALTIAALLAPDLAYAQAGGDIAAGAERGFQWLLNLVRIIGAFVVFAGFMMFAGGRFHWMGGIVMLVGILGAAKADAIANYLMGA